MADLLGIILTVGLLCIGFFLYRSRNGSPPKGSRGVGRPEHPGIPSPSRDLPRLDSMDQTAAALSSPVPVDMDAGTQALQERLADGMSRLFSPADDAPQEKPASLLRLEDVRDEVRKRVSSHVASLKNFDTVSHLQRVIGDPRTTMADLTRMVTSNPLLSAKILQIANSAYYRMEQKLNSVSHAIMIIGMVNLKTIIYHEGVLQALQEKSFRNQPAMQSVWQHANYTAIYASYLHYLFGGLNMGNLFTLGLLHDIGKFILMRLTPLSPIGEEPPLEYSPDWTMAQEEEVYGINHALVGQLALQHWGLSRLLVDTVTLHHVPAHATPPEIRPDRETLQYLLVMFLADRAARMFAGGGSDSTRSERLHPEYHGLIDRNQLSRLLADKSLIGQLREAEAITGIYA